MLAEIFVNLPVKSLARAFTYRVPPEFSYVGVGWRVIVPFSGRPVEGFILLVADEAAQTECELKDIVSVVDEEPWFTPRMLAAARWLSDYYLCSPAEAMRLFMPGKSGVTIRLRYKLRPAAENDAAAIMGEARPYRAALDYLAARPDGAATLGELRARFPEYRAIMADIMAQLANRRLVERCYDAKKREIARWETVVTLAELPAVEKPPRFGVKQLALLAALRENGGRITHSQLKEREIAAATAQSLAKRGLVKISRERILRDSYAAGTATLLETAPPLSDEQRVAVDSIGAAIESGEYAPFLLYGVTGSGKTRVYLEATAKTRARGRQVVLLVPEIALTGQLVAVFQRHFAGDIVVLHSQLTLAERADAVRRIRENGVGIVIGARSALFTPLDDIGLIILDEEQDMSYKQDEAPRYHARDVAAALSRIHRAALILGSATPSLETAYRAAQGKLRLLKLTQRIGGRSLPATAVVDMRRELKNGSRGVISDGLKQLITETLAAGKQTILMLNRRGYSTFVMCRSCGYVVKCPACSLPMVYHLNGRLACHHCDVSQPSPAVCPQCGGKYIRYFGAGTEKLAEELQTLVPTARLVRLDRDTARGKMSHQKILAAFRRGEYDILLGTQMVAKGHDIPNVTAVGVLSADAALNLPDFRAAERCFMLITQTAGRAGRGDEPGRVLVQGYNPEHYAVTAALAQNYGAFYKQEIALRRQLFFPPFCRLVKLTFLDRDEARTKSRAARLVGEFRRAFPHDKAQQIIGPAPALVACLRGVYRYAALIKSADLAAVRDFLRRHGLDRQNDVQIDVDPINTI